MSTTSSTRTRTQKGQLKRKNEAFVSVHWTQITQYLAPPGVAWTWGECGLSHRLKYQLKERGLIYRSPGDDAGWMTTEVLWFHVIERADPDERVGVDAQGQQLLDAPQAGGKSRLVTDTVTSDTIGGSTQSTLNGDTVEQHDQDDEGTPDKLKINWMKDPTRSDARAIASNYPTQARLAVWMTEDGIDKARWDVSVNTEAGIRLAD